MDNSLFKLTSQKERDLEKISAVSLSFWKDVRLTFKKNHAAVASSIILVIIVLLAIFGPWMGFYGRDEDAAIKQEVQYQFLPPKIPALSFIPLFDGVENGVDLYEEAGVPADQYFIFGSDNLGRDMWTRIWIGTRISLFIGLMATLIDLVIGVTVGGVSGYFGGRVDLIFQRVMEILSSIPMLIVVIMLILVLEPGIFPIIIALGLTGWIGMARIVRGQFYKNKEQEYVYASRTLGASNFSLIFKHLLPNTYPTIVIWLMFTIPGAIFTEAFLSFIGLGVTVPNASLGSLINDGRAYIALSSYLLIYPALVLSVLMIGFNLVADGLRDAFDPKTRGEK